MDIKKLSADVCPACDCKITAEKIIRDNPNVDLTKYTNVTTYKLPDDPNMKIQIGKDIYTKKDLETVKLSNEK